MNVFMGDVGTAAVLSQRTKAANLYFLKLVALWSPFVPHDRPNAEAMSPAKGREVQPSFER